MTPQEKRDYYNKHGMVAYKQISYKKILRAKGVSKDKERHLLEQMSLLWRLPPRRSAFPYRNFNISYALIVLLTLFLIFTG